MRYIGAQGCKGWEPLDFPREREKFKHCTLPYSRTVLFIDILAESISSLSQAIGSNQTNTHGVRVMIDSCRSNSAKCDTFNSRMTTVCSSNVIGKMPTDSRRHYAACKRRCTAGSSKHRSPLKLEPSTSATQYLRALWCTAFMMRTSLPCSSSGGAGAFA